MSDPSSSQAANPQEATSSTTVTVVEKDEKETEVDAPTLKLRLKKPKTDKKIKWTEETVDNEHMNKKKSKCCCIYKKPRKFGESSSSSDEDSDDECEHCKGHVEKKKHKKRHLPHEDGNVGGSENQNPDSTVTN